MLEITALLHIKIKWLYENKKWQGTVVGGVANQNVEPTDRDKQKNTVTLIVQVFDADLSFHNRLRMVPISWEPQVIGSFEAEAAK